jgi:hypothetical protein
MFGLPQRVCTSRPCSSTSHSTHRALGQQQVPSCTRGSCSVPLRRSVVAYGGPDITSSGEHRVNDCHCCCCCCLLAQSASCMMSAAASAVCQICTYDTSRYSFFFLNQQQQQSRDRRISVRSWVGCVNAGANSSVVMMVLPVISPGRAEYLLIPKVIEALSSMLRSLYSYSSNSSSLSCACPNRSQLASAHPGCQRQQEQQHRPHSRLLKSGTGTASASSILAPIPPELLFCWQGLLQACASALSKHLNVTVDCLPEGIRVFVLSCR